MSKFQTVFMGILFLISYYFVFYDDDGYCAKTEPTEIGTAVSYDRPEGYTP
jgi:hypothetical protein